MSFGFMDKVMDMSKAPQEKKKLNLKLKKKEVVGSEGVGSEGVATLPHGQAWIQVWKHIPQNIQMSTDTFEAMWQLCPKDKGVGKMFGRDVTFQRYEQAYGHDYYYAGQLHVALPIPQGDGAYLQTILDWVRTHSGQPYDGILINWYPDGQHYIGAHSDKEKSLVPNAPIYSFSFGQERDFVINSKDKSFRHVINMTHNSLIIMGGDMQTHYKHSVPKRALSKCPDRRINMTFRLFQR